VVEQLLTQTTLTPYAVDGQVEGIQITGLDKIPLAGVLGLKEGDVIHIVNGQTLTSKQKAFQILKKAKSQETLDIELLRDGQSKTLSFPIR
jgi:type II secretory pathway component PulC